MYIYIYNIDEYRIGIHINIGKSSSTMESSDANSFDWRPMLAWLL